MDLEEVLWDMGLTKQESEVYLALLKAGTSLASKVSRQTQINRSLVYKILGELIGKGFVNYVVRENIRYYSAVDPEKLKEIMRRKQEKLKEALPALQKLKSLPKGKKPIIEILEGAEGIRTMLWDLLRVGQTWYAFNTPGKGPAILGPYAHAFEKERQKQKIVLNVICLKTKDGLKRAKDFEKMKYTNVRYMHERYDSPASNWIYGDRMAMIFWYKDFPFAMRIIDKNLAESYKKYFKALWKYAEKRVTSLQSPITTQNTSCTY